MKVGIHLNGRYWIRNKIVNSHVKEVISDRLVTPLALYTMPFQSLCLFGVEAIQIGLNGYTHKLATNILKKWNRESVSLHGPYESPEYNLASSNPKIRCYSVKTVEKMAKIAEEIGSFLVIHPGGGRSYYGSRCTLQAFYESLEELCDKGLGRSISVETKPNDSLDYVLRTTPEGLDETETMLKLFPVNITLDVSYVTYGHEDVEEANEYVRNTIRRFNTKINCVHCSEIRRGVGNHLGIGEGTIDWPRIVRELRKVRYKGDLIVEVRDFGQCIASVKKLRSMVDHVYN